MISEKVQNGRRDSVVLLFLADSQMYFESLYHSNASPIQLAFEMAVQMFNRLFEMPS